MTDARIVEAAARIWSAWQEGRLIEPLPESCRPRDLDEGYAMQAALQQRHAGDIIGWKIAATSAAGQKHIGVPGPLFGRLFARFAHGDGAALPVGVNMRVAEAEFCFRMGADLPPRTRPYDIAEVTAAVAALHLAIEIPDSRYREYAKVGAAQLAADDACACSFILGPEAPASWRDLDLAAHVVTARINDRRVAEGRGANVLGGPLIALTWIANELAGRGRGLRAGEVITTGTCIPPAAIAPGDSLVADFGVLGEVQARFV